MTASAAPRSDRWAAIFSVIRFHLHALPEGERDEGDQKNARSYTDPLSGAHSSLMADPRSKF
jgi:hypothetical protein